MRKHLLFIALMLFALSSIISSASLQAGDKKEVKIKTTARCKMCKNTIEKNLNKQDGIISTDVEVKTAVLTVEYDPEVLNENEIRVLVTKTGYDADSLKADKEAYNKLMNCCKLPKDR